ncbi:TPA: hypothetical protein ACF36E_002518, partial [Escherichia coli]
MSRGTGRLCHRMCALAVRYWWSGISEAAGRRYQYDRHGQVVQITDVRGGNKYLQWNEDGQLMRHTDCSGSQTAWFYDERTRLIRMTDAQSHSTCYGYDDSGHLTEVILADG